MQVPDAHSGKTVRPVLESSVEIYRMNNGNDGHTLYVATDQSEVGADSTSDVIPSIYMYYVRVWMCV